MLEISHHRIDKKRLFKEIENIIKNDLNNLDKVKPKKKKKKKVYIIEDFTKYHDIEFIENLYRKILLREVDKEALDKRLELLRSGKRTKSEILSMVRFSKEGREKNIPILGIKKRLIYTILNRIPIINFFTNLFILPHFIKRINRFEAQSFIYIKEQNKKLDDIEKQINNLNTKIENIENKFNNKLENIKNRLNTKIENFNSKRVEDIEELKTRIHEIKRAKESLKEIKKNISSLISNIKDERNIKNTSIMKNLQKEINSTLDEFYISFEDRFRGSREDIKNRQSYYLPIIKNIIKDKNNEIILDIGCGRGEWLELLKNNHFKAKGVDLNRLMVKESKNLGLDTTEKDALEYLKSLKENSISVITGFHIVEHLPFETLIELFDESYRVLKMNGAIIFETPNPENLRVGAYSFYIDPTHKNPIPPDTLQFIAQNRGFKDVRIYRLHPLKQPELTDNQDINNLLIDTTKAQDYAIIGYK